MSVRELNHIRALGIVGSPRRKGNTDMLVDAVLGGAEEAGALTDKVLLNELNISPCQSCNRCESGECIQHDDMAALLTQMEQSQLWVLGTPIYWWGPSAQFKTFLDRWYGVRRVVFKNRQVILVIPLGGSERFARHTVGMLTDVFNYLGMNLVATILAPGASRLGAVRSHAAELDAAHDAGQKAVEM